MTSFAPVLHHASVNPSHALAPQGSGPGPTPIPGSGGGANPFEDFNDFLLSVMQFLQVISFTVFVICVTIAGLMYMTTLGGERNKENAMKAITGAVVGLIIGLMATGVHSMIVNAFPQH